MITLCCFRNFISKLVIIDLPLDSVLSSCHSLRLFFVLFRTVVLHGNSIHILRLLVLLPKVHSSYHISNVVIGSGPQVLIHLLPSRLHARLNLLKKDSTCFISFSRCNLYNRIKHTSSGLVWLQCSPLFFLIDLRVYQISISEWVLAVQIKKL